MATQAVRKKKGKSSEGRPAFTALSFVIICVAIAFSISVFFRVSEIEVVGAEYYSAEEIIEASGIEKGDSLISLNGAAVEEKISGELLFAGNARVSKKIPDTVLITISESGASAAVKTDEGTWLIDNYCRLLEPAKGADRNNYVEVIGVSAVSPEAGRELSVPAEDKHKATYLKEILFALSEADMLGDVESIDVSNSANAEFTYLDRFTVKLGQNENTSGKLEMLESAASEIKPAESGVFDLSEKKKASFKPEEKTD